jgi:biopolymer transport protein ExbB
MSLVRSRKTRQLGSVYCILLFFSLICCGDFLEAQLPEETPDAGISQAELQELAAEAARNQNLPAAPTPNAGLQTNLNFLKLLVDGGALMIPIAAMSLLVVAVALERFLALRKSRLLPRTLYREIRKASESVDPISPHTLYQCSEQYPSVTARMLQDLLQKVGRPVPEMEATIASRTQMEADQLFGNVRWLTLAAAVTPLIGLLGTVWGMIIAFYNTTQLGAGTNKAEFLAEGIYVALVTTLGGLAVAIPAAIFAHYFEGKIQKTLAVIELELKRLVPRFEELEGLARYDISARGLTRRESINHAADRKLRGATDSVAPLPPPPPARPPASRTK